MNSCLNLDSFDITQHYFDLHEDRSEEYIYSNYVKSITKDVWKRESLRISYNRNNLLPVYVLTPITANIIIWKSIITSNRIRSLIDRLFVDYSMKVYYVHTTCHYALWKRLYYIYIYMHIYTHTHTP